MSGVGSKVWIAVMAFAALSMWIPIMANVWKMASEEYHSSQAFKFAIEGNCEAAIHHAARGKPYRLDLVEKLCPLRAPK